MWVYTCRQTALLQCMLGEFYFRPKGNVSVSLVIIGEPAAPGLAGQAINCPGHSAPVADPIVYNAGSHIVWKQERKSQQGLRCHTSYHSPRFSPLPLAFLLEEITQI